MGRTIKLVSCKKCNNMNAALIAKDEYYCNKCKNEINKNKIK